MADDAVEGLVDSSGSMPSVDWTQLAATFVGTIALGWFYGVISYIDYMYTGITNGIVRATIWVSADLIPELYAGIIAGIETSYLELELWLESLGPAAPVFAVVIIALMSIIMIMALVRAVEIVVGVI